MRNLINIAQKLSNPFKDVLLIDKEKTFTRVLFGAGISLFATVSTGQIHFAMTMLFIGGICLGPQMSDI